MLPTTTARRPKPIDRCTMHDGYRRTAGIVTEQLIFSGSFGSSEGWCLVNSINGKMREGIAEEAPNQSCAARQVTRNRSEEAPKKISCSVTIYFSGPLVLVVVYSWTH